MLEDDHSVIFYDKSPLESRVAYKLKDLERLVKECREEVNRKQAEHDAWKLKMNL